MPSIQVLLNWLLVHMHVFKGNKYIFLGHKCGSFSWMIEILSVFFLHLFIWWWEGVDRQGALVEGNRWFTGIELRSLGLAEVIPYPQVALLDILKATHSTVSCTVQTLFSFSTCSAFSFLLWFWSTRNYSGIGCFPIIRCSPMFLLLLLWFQGILCRIPVLVDSGLRK